MSYRSDKMAPRQLLSFADICRLVRGGVPDGEGATASFTLGQHCNASMDFDGTRWFLYPMLLDQAACDAARAKAVAGWWTPEHEEKYRTVRGEALCTSSSGEEFIELLTNHHDKGYWAGAH